MNVKDYANKPNALLAEIGFAGAKYGLLEPSFDIASALSRDESTRAAGTLLVGIIALAQRETDYARLIFRSVQDNPSYANFHQEAKVLESLVQKK